MSNMRNFFQQKRSLIVIRIVLSLTIILIPGSYVRAAQEDTRLAPLIEGAKKERKLLWYAAGTIMDAMKVVKSFNEKYPFINVEINRAKGEENAERILKEATAGRYVADVFNGKLRANYMLKNKNLLAKYIPIEAASIPKEFIERDGYWVTFYIVEYVVAYNTKLLTNKEVPRSYDDLLDSKWKGKIAMDYNEYDWFMALIGIMGREQGVAYAKKLAAQKPILRYGHNLTMSLLVAGEFPLSIAYIYDTKQYMEKGAPVNWLQFDTPIPAAPVPASVLAKAPHPNGARLFAEHLASREVHESVLSSVFRTSPRIDVMKPWIPKKSKLFLLQADYVAKVQDEYSGIFNQTFH